MLFYYALSNLLLDILHSGHNNTSKLNPACTLLGEVLNHRSFIELYLASIPFLTLKAGQRSRPQYPHSYGHEYCSSGDRFYCVMRNRPKLNTTSNGCKARQSKATLFI